MQPSTHPNLLVGTDAADDAAVWRRPDGRALIATVDFFTPLVDDPFAWGEIAAANAASDVYAMGGRPLFALNLVAWPRERLSLDVLGEVLAGGGARAEAGGWLVVGGHTVDGEEPLYGQAVIGDAVEAELLTNAGARPGQALVLTKALGTGLVATAVKRSDAAAVEEGGALAESYGAALASMRRLNDEAATVARAARASAATDITGFGLVGHLGKLARASGVAVRLDLAALPFLPGAEALGVGGFVPGGTLRNLDHARAFLNWARPGLEDVWAHLVADPQTSGGLLFSCPLAAAADAVATLRDSGHAASVIGAVLEAVEGPAEAGGAGAIHLVDG